MGSGSHKWRGHLCLPRRDSELLISPVKYPAQQENTLTRSPQLTGVRLRGRCGFGGAGAFACPFGFMRSVERAGESACPTKPVTPDQLKLHESRSSETRLGYCGHKYPRHVICATVALSPQQETAVNGAPTPCRTNAPRSRNSPTSPAPTACPGCARFPEIPDSRA